jgi:hypothetical protein
LNSFEKWSIWVTSALVFITGSIYLVMKYWLPAPDAFSVIHHPLQPLFLKLHILTAPLLVFAFGSIALRHVWRHYSIGTREGRVSGVATAILLIPMVLTGYLIQAITGESALRAIALTHMVTGVGYGVVILGHQIMVHRRGRSLRDQIAKGDKRRRRKVGPD